MTISNHRLKGSFPKLADALSCTGCLACYNACKHNAIMTHPDAEGFIYPIIQQDACIGCKLCEKVCPILGNPHKNPVSNIAYAAWIKDKKKHRKSSSGGLYSAIADYVFKKNGIVFGAAFNANWELHHIATTYEKEFAKTRGSKYVQSNIGTTFKEVRALLSKGQIVLFTGTPCQISGLKSYLDASKCNIDNLCTIDLVCHGVPSPLVFHSYLTHLEKCFQAPLKSFTCRDKKWSWLRFNYKATFENGRKYYGKWEEDFFSRGFLREYFLRSSCHHCLYATEQRCGDFTLCDYWGYYRKPGEIDNKDWGVSLVIPNTQKAKEIYKAISQNLVSYKRDINEAMSSNQAFHRCFDVSPLRGSFWKDFRKNGFEGVIEKYLYPEEILPKFKNVYIYGRKGVALRNCINKQKSRIWVILSKLKHLLSQNCL